MGFVSTSMANGNVDTDTLYSLLAYKGTQLPSLLFPMVCSIFASVS